MRRSTEAIAERLAASHPELILHRCPEPDYGEALKQGIERARGRLVICEEIDLCDDRFHRTALAMLDADPEAGGGGLQPSPAPHDGYFRRFATASIECCAPRRAGVALTTA